MTPKDLACAIHNAKSVVFFTGPIDRELSALVERVAEQVSAIVLRTPDATNYSRCGSATDFGPFAFCATADGKEAMALATLVVAIENQLSGFATRAGRGLDNKNVVFCGRELPRQPSCEPQWKVLGDPFAILSEVERELAARADAQGDRVFHMHPRAALRVINNVNNTELTPLKCAWFMDISLAGMAFAGQELQFGPDQYFKQDVEGVGCMGQALGESIGARLAAPPSASIGCVVGDGTFRMFPTGELHALKTSGRGGRYVLVVLENCGFQFVDQGVRKSGISIDGIPIGTWCHAEKPDFVSVARGWRLQAHRCRNIQDFRHELKRALGGAVPVVLEVPINPDFAGPIDDRAGPIAELFGREAS